MVSGNVDECPYCHSEMRRGLAPFHFHGSYIGQFEAYICNFCHRVFFTERAYHEIMEVPTSADDFLDFVDQKVIDTKAFEESPLVSLKSESNSSKNKVCTNEEELLAS